MEIQESSEMYLETILILTKKMNLVRSVDVCEYMGYSKPSVSRAVNNLKSGGYITIDRNHYITLTNTGQQIAESIYERHNLLSEFLVSLGVRDEIAVRDACKLEHHISSESFEAIKQLAKELKKDC